ncbi:MAG: chalcone isomerase family protein [Myxococcales bacterium]
MKTIALATALFATLAAAPVSAQPLVEPSTDIKFEKAPTIDGKPYLCLGTGLRKKAFFKVYAMVFCVEDAAGRPALAKLLEGNTKSAAELADDHEFFKKLMALPVEKAAEMVFVRNVGKEKMKEAFEESLTKALGKGEKARIDAFLAANMDKDLKEGDHMILRTKPSGELTVGLVGALKTSTDPVLAPAVWSPYLGADSVAPSLKKAVAEGALAAVKK